MNQRRIDDLSEHVFAFVFTSLDAEPELAGEEAGEIATKVQQAFRDACEEGRTT